MFLCTRKEILEHDYHRLHCCIADQCETHIQLNLWLLHSESNRVSSAWTIYQVPWNSYWIYKESRITPNTRIYTIDCPKSIASANGYWEGESLSVLHLNVNSRIGTFTIGLSVTLEIFCLSLVCFDTEPTYYVYDTHSWKPQRCLFTLELIHSHVCKISQCTNLFVQLFQFYSPNMCSWKKYFCLAKNCTVSLILFTGMAWSFRFSTLSKKQMNPIMTLPRQQHFEIAAWLNVLDLPQYNGMIKPNFSTENCNLELAIKYISTSFYFKYRKLFQVHRCGGADILLWSGYKAAGGSKLGSSSTHRFKLGGVPW